MFSIVALAMILRLENHARSQVTITALDKGSLVEDRHNAPHVVNIEARVD